MAEQDRWSRWLLESRFGGDPQYEKEYLAKLREVRDGVLNHRLALGDGAVVLDVGAGDGLIGFGALDRMGPTGRVIFSDISRSLLDHCRSLAAEMAMSERCEFVEARAEDLRPIADDTVDAVTTRSVLIYVADTLSASRVYPHLLNPAATVSPSDRIDLRGRHAWRLECAPLRSCGPRRPSHGTGRSPSPATRTYRRRARPWPRSSRRRRRPATRRTCGRGWKLATVSCGRPSLTSLQ